jgi:hypothetical protein
MVQRFLIKLPQAMQLSPYTEWVETSTLRAFALQTQLAKQHIQSWTPSRPEWHPQPEDPAVQIDMTKRQLQTILFGSRLEHDVLIRILNELLSELKK